MMNLSVIVLAAGLGTRMRSEVPKVLHPLCGKPVLHYVLEALSPLKPEEIIVVVNKSHKELKEYLGERVKIAIQDKALGTGHALKAGLKELKDSGTVLVINGDTPLIKAETLKTFIKLHSKDRNSLSLLSFFPSDPSAYGRIIRNGNGKVIAIKEKTDLTPEELNIREVNSGIYLMEPHVLSLVNLIKKNPLKGEYYLTDIVSITIKKGLKVDAYCLGDETEFMGINTRKELSTASAIMRKRINENLMLQGVTMIDPENTYIESDVKVGMDTTIYPGVFIEGKTTIGKNCIIHSNVRIVNSVIGDGVTIKDSSVIEDSVIKDNVTIGPFAHLRPGSVISENVKIGNFVEIKKSIIGEGTKAMHLSYIGDAEVGRNVNIGAGTITCNYDGFKKHKTIIEDNVFIGSDTQLVAPVKVSKGAYIGAGSTITKDVPPECLAITRTPQRHIPDWVKKRKKGKD
jgi:bifunctional UDP-N-acetylglucosamine pyrophosphorylase/glucosamine-1-phosphate N-acetyltransferase